MENEHTVVQSKGKQNDAECWLLGKGLATSAPEVVLQQLLSTGGPSQSVLTLIKYLAEKHLLKCTRGRKWKLKQIQRTIWHSYQMICLSKNVICNKNKHLGDLYYKCSL